MIFEMMDTIHDQHGTTLPKNWIFSIKHILYRHFPQNLILWSGGGVTVHAGSPYAQLNMAHTDADLGKLRMYDHAWWESEGKGMNI